MRPARPVPLPFNLHLPDCLRVRYRLALGVLPLSGLFAPFALLFQLIPWLEAVSGVPAGAPVRDHPYGGLWVALMLGLLVLGMLLGYLLGWVLNALIARWLLGWETSQVRAVFWCSAVPEHWLKIRPARDAEVKAQPPRLGPERRMGAGRFILTRGVLAWETPLFAVLYLIPSLQQDHWPEPGSWLTAVALWWGVGSAFGAWMWWLAERRARRVDERDRR